MLRLVKLVFTQQVFNLLRSDFGHKRVAANLATKYFVIVVRNLTLVGARPARGRNASVLRPPRAQG